MKRTLLPLVVLTALVLGVGNAAGRVQTTHIVTVQVIGRGTVTSPSGINCGNGNKTCYLAFTSDSVTLTAAPATGWTFAGTSAWDGCSTPSGTSCALDLTTGDKNVTANFSSTTPATTGTLSVSYTGTGLVDGNANGASQIHCGTSGTDCAWTEVTGSTLTVVETPGSTSVFSDWDGDCSTGAVSCTVQLDGDKAVKAKFVTANPSTSTLTVTIVGSGKVNGGHISCDGPATCASEEPDGSLVALTAEPFGGYTFTGWTGACSGTGTTCTVSMDAARSVTATFTAAITLTVTVNGNGNVSGGSGAINCGLGANICSASFAANATVTLVASPATGATFTGWTGACGGTATTCTVSMNQSKSVTATFTGGTAAGFTLSVIVTGNGTVTGGGISCGSGQTTCTSPSHTAGSTVALTATPTGGATFTGWGGACTGAVATCTVTFSAATTVTATFTGGTSSVQLSVSVSGPGKVTGSGITCGNGSTTCSANVTLGTSVTLTATPASGAKFAGWGGSCSGTASTCTVSMSAAKSVSATFTTAGTPGTLTITVGGKGAVTTTAGACTATGASKTCVQHFKAGASVTLTAKPAAGQSFLGWSGACAGTKATCTVKLTTAQAVTGNFSSKAGPPPVQTTALSALGAPTVRKTTTGYTVTLRFRTTLGGTALVRGLRAGRTVVSLSFRVSGGRATVGPFPVKLSGLYTFEIRLRGRVLRMKACLGTCGRAHKGDPFVLVRETPSVTRTGDVWSVTLYARASQISDARIRAYRGSRLLVNQHFLGRATRMIIGPFLLGPGNYTLRLTATDPYGRTRTLIWIVSLGR